MFMACKAPFFSREHVLQLPGRCWLDGIPPAPEEFVAEENVNFDKGDKQASEGVVHADDNTVPAANLQELYPIYLLAGLAGIGKLPALAGWYIQYGMYGIFCTVRFGGSYIL
jgi:hypothetical protein